MANTNIYNTIYIRHVSDKQHPPAEVQCVTENAV